MSRCRANLPSVGIASFLKAPICEDFEQSAADSAVLGIPYDCGVGFRPGSRFGPRESRALSLRLSAWGGANPRGYWDINTRRRLFEGVTLVDCGDVDIMDRIGRSRRENRVPGDRCLLYHEVKALLQGVAARGRVVGFDLVEVNPYVDVAGQTCLLATTIILEFPGAIFDRPSLG